MRLVSKVPIVPEIFAVDVLEFNSFNLNARSMEGPDLTKITTDQIYFPLNSGKTYAVDILRLDKMHEFISGNKWFKLRYYLDEAKVSGKTIVTYGGAWSNHLLATAAACQLDGISCNGIVRGEEPKKWSPVLDACASMNMKLKFVSRDDYRKKMAEDDLNAIYIPEGGSGEYGARGASTICDLFINKNYTHVCCAAGTGTTAAGLSKSVTNEYQVIAINVLKNNPEVELNSRKLAGKREFLLTVINDYSFGGYARYTEELTRFMNLLFDTTGIPTDFVYTAKLFYAVNDLCAKNYFPAESQILIIHSGGLKGNKSLDKRTLIF